MNKVLTFSLVISYLQRILVHFFITKQTHTNVWMKA